MGAEKLEWGCPELRNATPCSYEFAHFRHASHSQLEQDIKLFRHLFCDDCQRRRNYVEIGALDGQRLSNTLMLETHFNWGGLLVEGQPQNAAKLLKRRSQSGRNTIFSEAVCAEKGNVTFVGNAGDGTAGIPSVMSPSYLSAWTKRGRLGDTFTVPCRPIGEMIRIAKLEEIHFFSLDVEGAELLVLQTMDWRVPVYVWMIEWPFEESVTSAGKKLEGMKQAQIRALMHERGYVEMLGSNQTKWSGGGNAVFVHPSLLESYENRSQYCRMQKPLCTRVASHSPHTHLRSG
jgi:FkbM family methyltransferase